MKDAGKAALNLELVIQPAAGRRASSIPRRRRATRSTPETEAEARSQAGAKPAADAKLRLTPSRRRRQAPDSNRPLSRRRARSGSTLPTPIIAFSGHHLFIGNFNGFNVYDLENPKKPKLLASIVCPAGRATCRCTASSSSCPSSRRAAASTAVRRASSRRSATSASAACACSTSPMSRSRSRSRRCRRAAAHTRIRSSPIRKTLRTSTSTARALARYAPVKSCPDVRTRNPRTIPTLRSSAST